MYNFITILVALSKRLIRNIYWIYRFCRIDTGKNLKISLPIIVEGAGRISLKDNVSLESYASFKVSFGSTLAIDSNCFFGKNVDIRIGSNSSLLIGNSSSIETGSRLFVNSNWVFHQNSNIATNCSIFAREKGFRGRLIMFENSYIGDNCIIDVSDNVTIGKNVAIGPNCTFYTHDHHYDDLSKPAWSGGVYSKPINIMEDAWIGSNITILPGIVIGRHSVIAAGSVVTKDVPDFTVWAGIPAKQIKAIKTIYDV